MVAVVMKDIAGAKEIRVFSGSGEAELVDVTCNAKMSGEIKASVDAEARDDGTGGAAIGETVNSNRWTVGARYGKAGSKLGDAKTRCSGNRLGMRPDCQAKHAR